MTVVSLRILDWRKEIRTMRALATAAVAIFAAACAPKPTVMLTCDDFKKNSDGTWTTVRKTTIKVNNTSTGLESPMIGPGVINVNGVDLAVALNERCGTPD
jgi:hypothetical protein